MGITAYTIKSLIGRITDKKYLTGINKEVIHEISQGHFWQNS
jgi:hypothetical protein